MNLLDTIKQYRERRRHKGYVRENTWNGLVPGDVVEYKGKRYRYMRMNPQGGPGMEDEPDPVFVLANLKEVTPREAHTVYYVRPINDARLITGDATMPKVFLETEEPARAGMETYIAFLNPKPGEFEKVGHIPAEECNRMIAEVQAELKGKATLTFDPSDI